MRVRAHDLGSGAVTGGPAIREVEDAPEALPSAAPREPPAPGGSPWRRGPRGALLAGAAYLLLSSFVWSNVWSTHPTTTTTCGCGDDSLFTWFFEWPVYAIAHGLDPLYTTLVNHPTGLNMAANTSVLALTIPLAPITWLFGPIAALNVALVLGPVLSALAMYVLVRRWVEWAPAAFVAGLAYGFSPFVLANSDDAHLMFSFVAVPPLIVLCLDELLFRQRRSPVRVGVALGLLVVVQFFVGTEVLLMTAILVVIGLVAIVLYVARTDRAAFSAHVHHATVGLGVGSATAAVLLAYPLGFLLWGPGHFAGPVWPQGVAHGSAVLRDLFLPDQHTVGPGISHLYNHLLGGYQGFILSPQYLGLGFTAVLVAGAVVWRRDRRLWLFGGLAVVSFLLAVGSPAGWPTPWHLLVHLPLVENIIPVRFVLGTFLGAAVMLGLILDHVYAAVRRRDAETTAATPSPERPTSWFAAGAALVVAAVAVVPQLAYVAQSIPATTEHVEVPTWFVADAPHLAGHQVVLVLPVPFSGKAGALTWQATSGLPFSLVGISGPAGVLRRAGKEASGAAVLSTMSFSAPTTLTSIASPASVTALRRALHGWGVTMAVVPDQPELTYFDQIVSVTFAAAMLTAATGQRPLLQDGAWVWTNVEHGPAGPVPSGLRVAACTRGLPTHGAAAVDAATSCILRGGGAGSG